MIRRTLGVGMVIGVASLAWAFDDAAATPPSEGTIAPLARDADSTASAQRRRRPRPGPSKGDANPYGGEGGDADSAAPPSGEGPASSSAAGSDDPRTQGGNGAGGGGAPASGAGGGEAGLQRSDRLDFDERLIQGQTARAGAVYLFSRPPRDLPELVKLRKSFRPEISRAILARDPIVVATPPPATPPVTGRTGARPAAGSGAQPAGAEGAEPREGRPGREGRGGRRGGRR